jgi:hypothetical protein
MGRVVLAESSGERFGETPCCFFRQKSENELGVYPSFCGCRLFSGKFAEVEKRFEPLEQKLYLPTEAIDPQDVGGFVLGREAREDHHLIGDRLIDLPIQGGEQVEKLTVRSQQPQRLPADMNDQMSSRLDNRTQIPWFGVPTVGKGDVAFLPSEPRQVLRPLVVGKVDVLDLAAQAVADMHAPRGSIGARITNRGCSHQPQPPTCPKTVGLCRSVIDKALDDQLQPSRRCKAGADTAAISVA